MSRSAMTPAELRIRLGNILKPKVDGLGSFQRPPMTPERLSEIRQLADAQTDPGVRNAMFHLIAELEEYRAEALRRNDEGGADPGHPRLSGAGEEAG